MRRSIIAANWKMHGSHSMVNDWFSGFKQQDIDISDVEVVVCPPFPYLLQAKDLAHVTNVKIGAQDISDESKGAFTGQVSAAMLKDSGCSYVIIGHSERRTINNERDALIAKKVLRALEGKLTPILCVGETLAQRQQDRTEEVVSKQLLTVLDTLTGEQAQTLVIAYEPVWAIGTGLAATTEQAQVVHAFLRHEISKRSKKQSEEIRIIYGGSVKPENAQELMSMPDIDGALVGGASLEVQMFAQIVTASSIAVENIRRN